MRPFEMRLFDLAMLWLFSAAIKENMAQKDDEGKCPVGWISRSSKCYYFSHNKTRRSSWDDAKSKCENMNASLVVIEDGNENKYLWTHSGNTDAWIGLNDQKEEDVWEWVDGSSIAYTNWNTNQPDNWKDAPGGREDCVMLKFKASGKWNDLSCNESRHSICQLVSCSRDRVINGFTFGATTPGKTASSTEKCPDTGIPTASLYCTKRGMYDLATFRNTYCQSIESFFNQNFTKDSLQFLQVATSDKSALSSEVVSNISSYLTFVSNLNENFSEKQVREVTEITSHLSNFYQDIPASECSNAKQDLVRSLSKISRKIDAIRPTSNGSRFSSSAKDVNIGVSDVTLSNSSYTFNPHFDTGDIREIAPMSIMLPAEAVRNTRSRISSQSVRIVSVGFRNSSLFPSQRTTGWVISSSLGNSTDSIEGLKLQHEMVTFTNNEIEIPGIKKINNFTNEVTEIECVFWDFNIADWSNEGCSVRTTSPATCQCNHLTNFAVLVSRSEIPNDFSLTTLTYVGCGCSIVGLLLTLLVICISRRLKRNYQMKVLGNVCFCLSVAFTLFVFGIGAQEPAIGCTLISVFMHFFFLAAWLWTGVYGFILHRDIARALASYGKPFSLVYAVIFAYGAPLVIVLLNAGIALGHIDQGIKEESSYRARNFCWLHRNSLYFGFLLSVGIVTVFNLAVFCIVIPKITCMRSQIPSSRNKSGKRRNVVTAVALVTTMGLSWISGFLMLVSDNHTWLRAMSWIFTIVTTFQGVFIFYFTAIRSGEIKALYASIETKMSSTTTASTGGKSLDSDVKEQPLTSPNDENDDC